MAKKLLKVSAGINLAVGGILLLFSLLIINVNFLAFFGGLGIVTGLGRIVIGAVFLSSATKEGIEFIKSRWYVLAASIVSILTCHVITFILSIIAFSEMAGQVPIEEQIRHELTEEERERKKLRNLLALGCGLVILAGFIFAMTTWNTLSGIGKTVSLIVATLIFFGLSYFAEKKFLLKVSAVTYYILANIFGVFAFVSAGYFEVFGEWFSFNGAGASLYHAFLWILVSVLSYLSYVKYDNKNIYYIFDISVLFAFLQILNFFAFGKDVILFATILISAIFALIPVNSEVMKKTNNLANIVFIVSSFILFTFVCYSGIEDRLLFNLLSFCISFITVYYLAIVNKELFYEIYAPLFTIGIAFMLSAITGTDSKVIFLQLMLISIVIYLIGFYKREQKWLFTSTSVATDLGLLYVLIDSLNLGYNYYAIAAALLLLGTSLMVSISRKFGKYYFEVFLEPLKVILLAYTVYRLAYRFEYSEDGLFIALIGFIFAGVCIFRNDFMKVIYFVGAVLTAVFAMFNNIREFAPLVQGFNVLSFGLLLFITFKKEERRFNRAQEFIYGLGLLAVALFLLNTFEYFGLKLIGIIILTVFYSALFIVCNKNDIFRCFTIVALLIPYLIILPISVWNDNVNYILYSLPWVALIFLYTRGFLASAHTKNVNIIEIVALSIWYVALSLNVALEIAVFVGVVSFVGILIGYRSDKWISLYYTGVTFLVLNTVVQLKEFWTSVPVWAYILVAGLVLIGIVTYKEYVKVSKKDNVEIVEAEVVSNNFNNSIDVPLDVRSVVAGSLLYVVIIPVLLQIVL